MRALGLLVLPVALGACGASAQRVSGPAASAATTATERPTTPSAPVSAPPTSTAHTSTPPPSTSPPSSTATAPPPSGPAPCTSAGLAGSVVSAQGAAGHGVIVIGLRNTGSGPCRTYGYPGVQFLDAADRPLPTAPHHVTSDFVGAVPAHELVVAAGQSTSFRLVVSHGSVAPAACATAHGLALIAPDDTRQATVAFPTPQTECGDVTVSPLQPGLSANPS